MFYSAPKIQLLPEHLIDQIKAGEVIERPANLIKEIIENAIDAGATKLELIIKNNGLDLISLKDNGHGINFHDLPLAFSRHATSKISLFEDLYKLSSFGFRGEALASIAAISKIQCITKTENEMTASEIRLEGGLMLFHGHRETYPFNHGTELTIKDLFFNTPARLKFIQSQQSEKNFIKKIIASFLASNPNIEFQIKIDDAEKDIYPATKELKKRINELFPNAKASVDFSERCYENYNLQFYLVPGHYKSVIKFQNIYINQRFILDKQLHRIITNTLLATFGKDDFHFFAFLELPSETIDVNVHPSKTVIKLMESSKIISLLTSTIKGLKSSGNESFSSEQTNEKHLPVSINLIPEVRTDFDLAREKQQYNMQGYFSPHHLPKNESADLLWFNEFIVFKNHQNWFFTSSTKILEFYIGHLMTKTHPTIPLMVSEPFSTTGINTGTVDLLNEVGFELEYLGDNTIVLRGIPDWMNGFPLRDIVTLMLQNKSFSSIKINPLEWGGLSWKKIIEHFPINVLIENKIVFSLISTFREQSR